MIHCKYQRLSPRLVEVDGEVQAAMRTDQDGGYVFHDELVTCRERLKAANNRLAVLADSELELQTKIYELKAEMEGPGEYATWKDAAIAERLKRVAAEKEIQQLRVRDTEAVDLVGRWLAVNTKLDWKGFQLRVEKFLGLAEVVPDFTYYDDSELVFRDGTGQMLGCDFYDKWIDRSDEFPQYRASCIGTWP